MQFKEFLTKISSPDFLTSSHAICFTSVSYPSLFFSTLFDWLKAQEQVQIQSIRPHDHDFVSCSATLSTTFLGMSSVYWLGNVDEIDAAHKKKIVPFLANYAGPHTVIYFVPQESAPDSGVVITLPDVVDKNLFVHLFTLLHGKTAAQRAAPAITALFARVAKLQLDTACMLLRYIVLVGGNSAEFIEGWLDALVVPDQSLFTLSQYFFSKNSKEFFTYWARIGKEYSEVFWVTFWSEQLWRASHVVALMQRNQVSDAKAIAYRLPFSLLQRDWKKLTAQELRSAHDEIYSIDCSIKNGGNAHMLDLLYSKFFQGGFK